MTKTPLLLLISVAGLVFAQGRGGAPAREAPVKDVPYARILNADKEPENWLTHHGTYMSQRHSQLKQVTTANARELELKWIYQSKSVEKHETTPLVVDGVMYAMQAPNDIVALDAATGGILWTFAYKNAPESRNPCCGNVSRGLAILNGNLYMATIDAALVAVNARTGRQVWKVQVGDYKQQYSMTHAPLAIKDKIIVGVAGGEKGIRGYIRAYDAATGAQVWNFNTVPGPGEVGAESWSGDSYLHGGAPIWVTGSYDPATNLTFWGTGNPGPDWDGRGRLGDNLYSCSVIALDVDTGKLSWHYQFNPHNEYDWDATQVPVLADLDFGGRPRKVMFWANRNGVFYALDRTNGQFLSGKSFVKTNWFTSFDEKGRPIFNPATISKKEGSLVYPGNQGGTNFYNPSYSPVTQMFYIPAWENTSQTYILGEEIPEFHEGQGFSGPFPRAGASGEDVHASVVAMDAKTGQRAWAYRLAAPQTEGGLLTTASNVLFGGARDGQFFALDAATGKLLWDTHLGAIISAGPVTYMVGGKQYVTIQAGSVVATFGLR
jgi:alcohol dehydrogenase (cytochrome c)